MLTSISHRWVLISKRI